MGDKKLAVISVGFLAIMYGFLYYLLSFPISLHSGFTLAIAIGIVLTGVAILKFADSPDDIALLTSGGFIVGALLVVVISVFNSSVFNSRAYSGVFTYDEKEFTTYTASIDNVPLLDKVSADNIAKRKFGELSDYVSQYKVIDSEQIIYKEKPVRVAVLEHTGFWSWKRNKTTPGYILVDMTTQKAELVRTEKPVVYSERAYFGKNIKRYIRSNYKTDLFFYPTAELNEEGELYWIAPTYHRLVGLLGGKVIDGVIAVNAHTGEHTHYTDLDSIPEWIDNVYPSKHIMEYYDYKGKLSNGYWNTWTSKTGMTMTTEGYNYVPQGNDNWIYTGITSVSMSDESNIAFILTNKRTMETHYYPVTGAEEYSAMESAEGEVQHLGYTATFPLLLNIDGIPTYVLSLKDKNDLVKMYAMVQVEDYRNVVVDSDLNKLKTRYLNQLNGVHMDIADNTETGYSLDTQIPGELIKVEGVLSAREIINIDGNSYIIIKVEADDSIYRVLAQDNLDLLFVDIGSKVEVQAESIPTKRK